MGAGKGGLDVVDAPAGGPGAHVFSAEASREKLELVWDAAALARVHSSPHAPPVQASWWRCLLRWSSWSPRASDCPSQPPTASWAPSRASVRVLPPCPRKKFQRAHSPCALLRRQTLLCGLRRRAPPALPPPDLQACWRGARASTGCSSCASSWAGWPQSWWQASRQVGAPPFCAPPSGPAAA